MTRKQQEAKQKAQAFYMYCKESAIGYFLEVMGYDTSIVKPFPKTWKEAIDRFK